MASRFSSGSRSQKIRSDQLHICALDRAAPYDTLRSEELGQDLERPLGRTVVELPKTSDQPDFVDCPKLVQRNVAIPSSE